MTCVRELEPRALWRHFETILTIPRGSKEEGRIREYVMRCAEQLGLPVRTDGAGNIIVRKPAAPGYEEAPVTILQGHLDMVNEKEADSPHDFTKDAIVPQRDGDYLKATGTTLGADNGMGIAAMLAVMEAKEMAHGPLELLFTVDEETGLTGASGLDGSLLAGRRFLNLDTEEEGALYVGCAGGADTLLQVPLRTEASPRGTRAWRVRLHGLRGGHSGVDIHLQRGNALKLLARALHAARSTVSFRVTAIEGGTKRNTIPREAVAVLVGESSIETALQQSLRREFDAIRAEWRRVDPELQLTVQPDDVPPRLWDEETEKRVLHLLEALPHGIVAMSQEIEGLVETSTNLATVHQNGDTLHIGCNSRSSVETALTAIGQRLHAIGALAAANVEARGRYPGWKPNLDSPLLRLVQGLHAREFGKEPAIKAIHAGLECGIIGEKIPGIDMLSFGPQIEFPHTPQERVKIDSVGRFYHLLSVTLQELTRHAVPAA